MNRFRIALDLAAMVGAAIAIVAVANAMHVWDEPETGPVAGALSIMFYAIPASMLAIICFIGARIVVAKQKAENAANSPIGHVLSELGLRLAVLGVVYKLVTVPWKYLSTSSELALLAFPAIVMGAMPGLILALIGFWLQRRGPEPA